MPAKRKPASSIASQLSAPAADPQLHFREEGLKFLRGLKRNNRRDWFDPRKAEFERELKQPMLALIETINRAFQEFAPEHVRPPQKCMMRIYRDTRFSADKRPYKNNIAAWWSRAGLEKTSGGGYYLHIAPDEVILAAGVYMPERDQLRSIREYLLVHHAEVRHLLSERKLRRLMNAFTGMPLTRAPKGFPKDHPAMDLLLCRQWGVEAKLEPTIALQQDFAATVVRHFRLATPLVRALNEPLVMAQQHSRTRRLFGF